MDLKEVTLLLFWTRKNTAYLKKKKKKREREKKENFAYPQLKFYNGSNMLKKKKLLRSGDFSAKNGLCEYFFQKTIFQKTLCFVDIKLIHQQSV